MQSFSALLYTVEDSVVNTEAVPEPWGLPDPGPARRAIRGPSQSRGGGGEPKAPVNAAAEGGPTVRTATEYLGSNAASARKQGALHAAAGFLRGLGGLEQPDRARGTRSCSVGHRGRE